MPVLIRTGFLLTLRFAANMLKSLQQRRKARCTDVIVTLIITLPVMQNQSETRNLYIQKIQAEVDEALRQTATLSRNAGADSAAILSRIRSNIYAVRMLNTVNSASGGKPLLEDERLTTLQNMVDRYLTYLTTGMDTGEYQTALQVSLSELQEIAGNLN